MQDFALIAHLHLPQVELFLRLAGIAAAYFHPLHVIAKAAVIFNQKRHHDSASMPQTLPTQEQSSYISSEFYCCPFFLFSELV
jgi:hypothetical protein